MDSNGEPNVDEERQRSGLNAIAEKIAMTLQFEHYVKHLQGKKQESNERTDEDKMRALNEIVQQTMNTVRVNIDGNQATKRDFFLKELNLAMQSTVADTSAKVFQGLAS